MSRIYFRAESAQKIAVPAYAVSDPDEIAGESSRVAQSIARANGCSDVITARPDGTRYVITIGHHLRSGGYSPVAEVWFWID